MSGKGDRQRPRQITKEEEDLRWELAFRCEDNPARKDEILKRLKELAEAK